MFLFLAYQGGEPDWAAGVRKYASAYSQGIILPAQLEPIRKELSEKKPSDMAELMKEPLQLDESLWMDFEEALPTLTAADQCDNTSRMVWRDLYFLLRSDAVIANSDAGSEIPLLATYLNTPVIAVSFAPMGLHPWLAHCAPITLNSPLTITQILSSIPAPHHKEDEDAEE